MPMAGRGADYRKWLNRCHRDLVRQLGRLSTIMKSSAKRRKLLHAVEEGSDGDGSSDVPTSNETDEEDGGAEDE